MQHYHHTIDQIIDHLQHPPKSQQTLEHQQQHLDMLASQYQADESLGNERYKLYQAQAMISYWQGNFSKSRQFIQESVRVKGESYKLADELINHLGPEPKLIPKPYKRWWVLIIAPFVSLILIAIAQIVVHFVLVTTSSADGYTITNSHTPTTLVINILSILVGIAAVVGIICLPVWIIMLLKAKHYNSTGTYSLDKTIGIILAVIFGPFYWLYTYERERTKFWLNIALTIVTFGYWSVVAWVWSIVEAATKSDEYFTSFPNVEK